MILNPRVRSSPLALRSTVAPLAHTMNHISTPTPSSLLVANLHTQTRNSVSLFNTDSSAVPTFTIPSDASHTIQSVITTGSGNLVVLGCKEIVKIYDIRTPPVARAVMKFPHTGHLPQPSVDVLSGRVLITNAQKGVFFTEQKVVREFATPPSPDFPTINLKYKTVVQPPSVVEAISKAVASAAAVGWTAPSPATSMVTSSGHILHVCDSIKFSGICSYDFRKSNTPFSSLMVSEPIEGMVGNDTHLICRTRGMQDYFSYTGQKLMTIPHLRGQMFDDAPRPLLNLPPRAASRMYLSFIDMTLHKNWLALTLPDDGIQVFDIRRKDPEVKSYEKLFSCQLRRVKDTRSRKPVGTRHLPQVTDQEAALATSRTEEEDRRIAAIHARVQAKKLLQSKRSKGDKAKVKERKRQQQK